MEIRITKDEILFPTISKSYKQKVGVSVAANMREALKEFDVDDDEVVVYIDTPVVLIPEKQFEDEDAEQLYKLSVTTSSSEEIVVNENHLSELDTVMLFSLSKDLLTVIEDNFRQFTFRHIAADFFLSEKCKECKEKKLYVFFYDKTMYAFAFKQGRLLFFNGYEASSAHDCAFLLLSVYKQLGYSQLKDKIELEGEVTFKEELKELLSDFVKNVSM